MWFVNGKAWKKSFFPVAWDYGREDKALQECNLSARPSVGCENIRPGPAFGAGIFCVLDATQTTDQSVKLIHILDLGCRASDRRFWN
jgi:hypothetical protein